MLQKIGVLVLLGVFSFYITPRDYLHHFAGHADTQDEAPAAHVDGLTISEHHTHCDWLQWEVDTYLPSHQTYLAGADVLFGVFMPALPIAVTTVDSYFFALRGPPAAIAIV
ncbi:hypothetical protein MKQ68_18330 [Chitinophaga horti]|uniref:Uncharacterized protein n=1 Tax=Chitinophaga horti TaxID=2920382 RepID=A0ABY6J078_9BACT|nr:hypothetical protein [Chitinophaga horti]UYQ92047.1 hypothetical protein MKQ68_18330 [Chitinophaga horti]